MESLWSPRLQLVAGSGNEIGAEPAQTSKIRCQRLPEKFMARRGVDGSSPSKGFAKAPANRDFVVVCSKNAPRPSFRGARPDGPECRCLAVLSERKGCSHRARPSMDVELVLGVL